MKTAVLDLDPELYHIIPDVPVVDCFDSFDPEWMHKTVERMQHLEATGNCSPLILGHLNLRDQGRKDDETPTVGLARNFRKADLPNLGVVPLADYWLEKQKLPQIREHCGNLVRWSAELWPSSHEIDPIALLGGTTPRRRLGTIQLSRGAESLTVEPFQGGFTMPEDKKVEPADSPKNLGMETINKRLDDLAAAMAQLTTQLASLSNPEAGSAGAAKPPESATSAPTEGAEGEEMDDPELEALIAQYEAQGKGGETKPAEAPKEEKKPEPKPMQASREAELEARIAELESKETKLQLSRELDALEKKGVLWESEEDKQEDLILLMALPAEQRVRQLSRIEKKYGQAPVGGEILDSVVQASRKEKTNNAMTPEQDAKIRETALRSNGNLSYEAACKVVTGKFPHEFGK